VIRQSRIRNRPVRIENIEALPGGEQAELAAGQSEAFQRLGMLEPNRTGVLFVGSSKWWWGRC
jgi:hypothetical protein